MTTLIVCSAVGTCWCVGALGAGLGGGHGRLQGKAGLIIDNMIQLRVVLANGTVINVSETENPDLFWGMRGAGQNFGIVVEANITTYPLLPGGTAYDVEMDFTSDQLEDVLYLANQQIAIQPAELSYYIFFGADPVTLEVSRIVLLTESVINSNVAYFPHKFRLRWISSGREDMVCAMERARPNQIRRS